MGEATAADAERGVVLQFPQIIRQRSCLICVHHLFDEDMSSLCSLVLEVIDSETTEAAGCEVYQEDERKS